MVGFRYASLTFDAKPEPGEPDGPRGNVFAPMSGDELLQRMATALGVSVDSFYILPAQHMFHVEADGTRWLLTSAAPGQPVIRCLRSGASDTLGEDQSVAAFLADNLERPQGMALAKLIDRVLAMHLHLSLREKDLAVSKPSPPGCQPLS